VVGLLPATSGSVEIGGSDATNPKMGAARALWRNMQMVFQDPYSSLNPKMTIHDALAEPLRNFGIATGPQAEGLIRTTLDACGLPASVLWRYPREFSGGQRQRIGIARALIVRPKFVIADEPVSALDVSIQAQIVNLMQDLKAEFGLTYLFIAHDLALVRHVSDWLAVMYRGTIVEVGPARAIYAAPKHPYTQLLISSIPIPDTALEAERLRKVRALRGSETASSGGGCAFAPRCSFATDRCTAEAPILRTSGGERQVACHMDEPDATRTTVSGFPVTH
jgi:oligopeptide/dipeptide ABC transporter ATP-binding protein